MKQLRPKTRNRSDPFSRSAHRSASSSTAMTIHELVSELRTTFRTSDFDRVEQALVARESRLNAEIEKQKSEIASLRAEIEGERLERISLGLQLEELKETHLKKEANDGFDLERKSNGENCRVCSELKKKWNDERDELNTRNSELECEKIGLLEEMRKLVEESCAIAELREVNRRLSDEKCRAEAIVEGWKSKFCEFNERVSRFESSIVNGKLVLDGGDGHCGVSIREKKMVATDDVHEFAPSKLIEDVGLSSMKSPIIPSKDGLCGSAWGRLGMTPVIYIEDSDEDEFNSRETLQRKQTTKIMAEKELPISSGAVQPKKLPVASSPEIVAANNGILDGLGSDTSSYGSSSSGSLDMDNLPLSKKRTRTEPASL